MPVRKLFPHLQKLKQKISEIINPKLKAKMRQRVRPKLGKIDIDYQKLHDAFFRYQTKPKMSRHGDIYYEVINDISPRLFNF